MRGERQKESHPHHVFHSLRGFTFQHIYIALSCPLSIAEEAVIVILRITPAGQR